MRKPIERARTCLRVPPASAITNTHTSQSSLDLLQPPLKRQFSPVQIPSSQARVRIPPSPRSVSARLTLTFSIHFHPRYDRVCVCESIDTSTGSHGFRLGAIARIAFLPPPLRLPVSRSHPRSPPAGPGPERRWRYFVVISAGWDR